MIFGKLETPSLSILRDRLDFKKFDSKLKISEVVGNVKQLHLEQDSHGAIFQAANWARSLSR